MATKNFEVKHGLSVGGTERISSAGAGTLTNLTLSGNLVVQGNTTTADNLVSADKNITLNYHASNDTSGSADGAGITVQDAVNSSTDASILWDGTNDEWDFANPVAINNYIGGDTVLNLTGSYGSGNNVALLGFARSGGGVSGDIRYVDASTDMEIGTGTAHAFSLKTSGTRRIKIHNDGKVDIGGSGGLYGLLTVTQASGADTDEGGIGIVDSSNGRSLRLYCSSTTSFINSGNGGAGNLVLNESAGKVGIGNTSPNGTLHLGTGTNSTVTVGTQSAPAFQIGGTDNYRLGMYTDSETGYIENKNGDDGIIFKVKTAGQAMRICGGDGDVYIGGNTDRSRKLVVEGTGDLMALYSTNSGAGGAQLDLIHDSSSYADGDSVGIINFSTDDRQLGSIKTVATNSDRGRFHIGVRKDSSTYNHNAFQLENNGVETKLDIYSVSGSNRGAGYFRFLTDGSSTEESVAQIYMEQGSGDGGSRKCNMYLQVADNGNPATAVMIENNKNQTYYGKGYWPNHDVQAGTVLLGGSQLTYDAHAYAVIGTNSTARGLGLFRDMNASYPWALFSAGQNSEGNANDIHFSPNDSDVQMFLGNQGGVFGGNSSHNLRASGGNFMFNSGSSNFIFEIGGVQRGYINASGFNNGSDISLKENIKDIDYGLNTVLSLKPRKFDWKEGPDEDKAEIGFIAQEVEEFIPEIISESASDNSNVDSIKGLNYGAMTAVLVKAIQELQAEINLLKEKVG